MHSDLKFYQKISPPTGDLKRIFMKTKHFNGEIFVSFLVFFIYGGDFYYFHFFLLFLDRISNSCDLCKADNIFHFFFLLQKHNTWETSSQTIQMKVIYNMQCIMGNKLGTRQYSHLYDVGSWSRIWYPVTVTQINFSYR